MRSVILHYHLFKNAGTSLDATFKENFVDGEWLTKEFSSQPEKNKMEVAEWILANPKAKCFSSHTARLQDHDLANVKVLPVIFVRHPIDRIASVYNFEKKQDAQTFGAVLARNTNMAGYVETRLSLQHDRQCRNFHTDRLAALVPPDNGSELERALQALEFLPFVGIVEQFNESLQKLERWLCQEGFAGLQLRALHKNVSRDKDKSLGMRLDQIEKTLGKEIFNKLMDENGDDIALYNRLTKTFVTDKRRFRFWGS